MNCTDWNEKLHDHLDATLAPDQKHALEMHLAICPGCRAQLESLQLLRVTTSQLPRELTPAHDLWPAIEAQLAEPRPTPADGRIFLTPFRLWKLAACIGVILTAAGVWKWTALRASSSAWEIAALAGSPRIDARTFEGASRLRIGQWLETDATSRARVSVGDIGEVDLEPNSRIRILDAAANDHRLELARGTLSALIWAPPRLFFVNIPSAVAVDLGCAYTLNVDDDGNGTLHVTSGYVALQHAGRESIISAGQMCATRRDAGPGTPFVEDAPDALRRALERFDFENAPSALPEILAHARAADAVTLFNLLTRTSGNARGAVFDALVRDHAPPPTVTRAGVIAGDQAMLDAWSAMLGFDGFANL